MQALDPLVDFDTPKVHRQADASAVTASASPVFRTVKGHGGLLGEADCL